MNKPIVWTIAGSDSGGYSGIQNDLITFQNLNTHGCSVITSITAQNSDELNEINFFSSDLVHAQIKVLENNLKPQAIKIGMLGTSDIINVVIDFLKNYQGQVVLDPVLISTSGKNLFQDNLSDYLSYLKCIIPYVDVVTPNIDEAEALLNCRLKTHVEIEIASLEIQQLGAKNVLIKGGHFNNDEFCQDYWRGTTNSFWLSHKKMATRNYRGTGCMLSSAITACLSHEYNLTDAIVIAKMIVNRGIRLSTTIDTNTSKLYYGGWPEEEIDLPYVTDQPLYKLPIPFNSCELIGLYPIIDSIDWVKKLLPTGIKTLQLRIKNKRVDELAEEIKESIELAKSFDAKLFINDYWQIAVRYGAYGIHLGQQDLNQADIEKIRQSGVRLGISTHCYYEVARAHAIRPSYIACGPIFSTSTKIMPFAPQGVDQLKRWRRTLNYPIVAIGGINQSNFREILATNVEGIAMISAITLATDPTSSTKNFLTMVNEYVI